MASMDQNHGMAARSDAAAGAAAHAPAAHAPAAHAPAAHAPAAHAPAAGPVDDVRWPIDPVDPREGQAITLMGLLVEAHSRLTRVLGAEMEEACGLPLSWYDAMIRLRRAPGGFTTMTRLASEVSLTSGGITRLVDRLVDAGYAERRSCPTDRRSVYVSLTPAGAAKVDEATAAHRTGLDRHLLAPLGEADRAALEKALRKLRAQA
jgi:MarR family 2-MHQ and catechol resistance regulon transcriptional repressor